MDLRSEWASKAIKMRRLVPIGEGWQHPSA